MPKSGCVSAVPIRIGDQCFNQDAMRFALVPSQGPKTGDKVVAEVETLVERYTESKSRVGRGDVMVKLAKLHGQGKILWPFGALFGHSVLGHVSPWEIGADLRSANPDLLVLLDELKSDPAGPYAHYAAPQKRAFTVATWKSLVALRLASTKPLGRLATYDHDDFEALAAIVRPGSVWAEWYAVGYRKAVQYAARHRSHMSGDPGFGASVARSVNPGLPGKRHVDPCKICPHLAWLDEWYERWLDETNVLVKKGARVGKRLIGEFLMTLPKEATSNISTVFGKENMHALMDFARTWSTPTQRIMALGKVNDFLDFLERQHSSGALKTEGQMLLGVVRHEIEHVQKSIQVPARASLSGDVQARPMPTSYHLRLKQIITADDFAWPKSIKNGVNGRPLHWVPWRDPATGRTTEVFCPVLPRLLLLQLDLPLRNVQARRLDSGEGDVERWDPGTGAWRPNEGTHGGRWKRMGAGNPRRGCIRRIPTQDGRDITGIWVNSNKTADRGVLFDDTAGYEIPWQHEDVLRNLAAMREWQERYNPVAGPLPHADLAPNLFGDEPSETVRALIPDRFYLFRYPPNPGPRGAEMPPSYFIYMQFFYDALEELERRLVEEDPERPVRIITQRDKAGAPRRAVFTLHGMRSSTLTSLHMAGVPIEMLSKLVAGHASILMTLAYIKFDPRHVSQVLTEAHMKAVGDAKADFPDLLGKATYEHAVRMTARLTDDGLAQIKGVYDEPSLWLRMDIGLCPNGGTQCRVGGEPIQRRRDKGADKSVYAPVPGGARNCVRCRFFVTGAPFLIPLWAHGSAVMARADGCARQAAERDDEVRGLKLQRKALRDRGESVPEQLRGRIIATEEAHNNDCERRDQALADFHATLTLIEKVRAISQTAEEYGEGGELPMLLSGDGIPEVVGRESTRFEVVDAVVQQSRVFPSLESPDLERERDEFLNTVLYRNGYVPITMAPLSLAERRSAADAMAAFLLIELGARETDLLASGGKTLADLGLQGRLEAACREAVGKPLDRMVSQPVLAALELSIAAAAE